MRIAAIKGSLAVLAVALQATLAAAQAPGASPSPTAGTDLVKNRLEQEIAPAPGTYVYVSQGRRDPFVSLLRPVSETGRRKGVGMESFLIQEVALKGIVKDKTGYVAMLLGVDGKSYFVKVGQRLFDGVITAIDAATVTFRQEVTDPLSSVRSRDVKKTLYPSEEGRQ